MTGGALNTYLNSPAVMKYKKIIIDIAKVMADYQGNYVTDLQLKIDAQDIVAFELQLAQVSNLS